MSNKNGTKIIAFIVLFTLIISVVGTSILYFFEINNKENQTMEITLDDLIKQYGTGVLEQINIGSGKTENNSNSGEISTGNTSTGNFNGTGTTN